MSVDSDIDNDKNHFFSLENKYGIIYQKNKKNPGILQDYFLLPRDPARMIPAEIKRPAIAAIGERGRAGVGEGTTAGGCVISGEETWVTVALARTTEVTVEFA